MRETETLRVRVAALGASWPLVVVGLVTVVLPPALPDIARAFGPTHLDVRLESTLVIEAGAAGGRAETTWGLDARAATDTPAAPDLRILWIGEPGHVQISHVVPPPASADGQSPGESPMLRIDSI